MPKVAVVVQRYGEEVIGGAEALAKQIAEKLVAVLDWDVDVLATTAKDYMTWANEYPEGMTMLNGVTVRRFHSLFGRSFAFSLFHRLAQRYLPSVKRRSYLRPLAPLLEKLWLLLQGPVCPKLIKFIETQQDQYEKIFFFTYLYYPTVWGYRKAGKKAVLIPTAHDEFAFHFETIRQMLVKVPRMLTCTEAESDLIRAKLQESGGKQKLQVAGAGIDTEFFRPAATTMKKIGVTYLGRISHGKNVATMLNWCQKHFPQMPVTLAGKIDENFDLPKNGAIDYRGFVSEEEKVSVLQGSQCLINPSAFESLSFIVLEAIACEVPVLVNMQCDVLAHYTKTCPSVFGFRTEEDFAQMLQKIQNTDWSSPNGKAALAQSRKWVQENYSWPTVLQKFQNTLATSV